MHVTGIAVMGWSPPRMPREIVKQLATEHTELEPRVAIGAARRARPELRA